MPWVTGSVISHSFYNKWKWKSILSGRQPDTMLFGVLFIVNIMIRLEWKNKANSLDREATEKIRSVLSGYGMYMWCGLALGHHLLGGRGEDGCGGGGGGADVYLGGADAAAIYQLRELLVKLRASLCYPEQTQAVFFCFYDDNGYCLYF